MEDLTLKQDHRHDEADHHFKVEGSEVQGELWAFVSVPSHVPRLAGDVVVVGQVIEIDLTEH